MHKAIVNYTVFLTVLVLTVFLTAVWAEEKPYEREADASLEEWQKLVEEALPPRSVIGEDNTALVKKLLSPVIGAPLKEKFQIRTALSNLFGADAKLKWYGPCRRPTTNTGDVNPEFCTVAEGNEAGRGALKKLSFSSNLSLGNIRYFNRSSAEDLKFANFAPVKMDDQTAYNNAVRYMMGVFGLPEEEIPPPPARSILPVRNVAIGVNNEKGSHQTVAVEKIVMIKRGFYVGAGEYLDYVPGPGRAFLVFNDADVQEAVIADWQEVIPHPQAYPEFAKTRTELVEEMTNDLFEYSKGPAASAKVNIVLSAVQRNDGVGLLLPSLRISVSPVKDDLSEEDQAGHLTSAGFIREYAMVHLVEESNEGQQAIVPVK